MTFKATLRIFHRRIAPWLLPSFLLLALTGLIYRIGRAWFAMSKETGGRILHLHSGEWLGDHGSVIYLIVVGGGLIFLIGSGLWLAFSGKRPQPSVRKTHRVLAIMFSLPLLVSAGTGIAYQVAGKWFAAGDGTLKILLSLHQGSWLGNTGRPFYILFLGLGLLGICATGVRLLSRKKPGDKGHESRADLRS